MHLELAVANIQRLTLENHRLRRERDEATRVTPITRARQREHRDEIHTLSLDPLTNMLFVGVWALRKVPLSWED